MNIKPLLVILSALLLSNCSEQQNTLKIPPLPDGAYLLKEVEITENGEVSVARRDQIKIYSNNRYMFAFMHPEIGVDAGAGIATWNNGIMIEEPVVNHDGSLRELNLSFDVAIEQTQNGFIQSIEGLRYDDGRSLDMIETWNIASNQESPFDGLWELESSTPIAILKDFAEIKMIGGGYFIWTNRFTLDGSKEKNFGFGKIDFTDEEQAIETGLTSSVEGYAGTKHEVELKLIGNNYLDQKFTMNGTKVVHRYKRI